MKVRIGDIIPIIGALRMSRRIRKLEAKVDNSIAEKEFLIQAYEARLNGIYKNLLELSKRADDPANVALFEKSEAPVKRDVQ